MEEKKFDYNSLIGMILLGGIMLWYFNTNKPEITPKKSEKKNRKSCKIDYNNSKNWKNECYNFCKRFPEKSCIDQ